MSSRTLRMREKDERPRTMMRSQHVIVFNWATRQLNDGASLVWVITQLRRKYAVIDTEVT